MILPRETHELASSHGAQVVIMGTYGESKDYIFVTLKVVQPQSNVVLAVHDNALPIDENTRAAAAQQTLLTAI